MNAPAITNMSMLDHGYIKLIETWGSDERIIESARMSTDGAFRGWHDRGCQSCMGTGPYDGQCPTCKGYGIIKGDEHLLKYLYENRHSTPFEFGGLIIEVQAPIMVFREWQRHRTQWYNELSARYTPLPDLYYTPTIERLMINSKGRNKQAGTAEGAADLTEERAALFRRQVEDSYGLAEQVYQEALRDGVPKELARVVMPVGHYSRMRAGANLRNWLAFMTLRSDPKAQWEIRQYSDALGVFVSQAFPRTWKLFSGEA